MPWTVTEFESTPNPNAVICRLDRRICRDSVSYRDSAAATEAGDVVAAAIFDRTDASCLFFCDDWLTVNKPADAKWPAIKRRVKAILAKLDDSPLAGESVPST